MTMTDLPTWTEEYRTADRSNWRTGGAWEDEPDKVVWVDEATGLDCMARRGPVGAWYFLALAEPRKVVADPDGMVEVDAL